MQDRDEHRLSRTTRVLALAAVEGTSVGLAGWVCAGHRWVPEFVRHNALSTTERRFVFLDMAVGMAIALAVLVAVLVVYRRRSALDVAERLVWRASPLAVAALVPLLFDARIWDGADLAFLALAAVFGLAVLATTRAALGTLPTFRALRVPANAALAVTCVAACAYTAYFAWLTITNHRNLGTSSFDLGLEDNLMWNLVHGGPMLRSTPFDGPTGTHLRNHATFFAYVLAPIYAVAPRPETLLVVQAAIMGGAAVPLHLWARRHVSPLLATLASLAYLAYPPLHGANLYDFHYLPLGVLFLWLVLYAVEARRPVLAAIATALALSVREDVACCVAMLGVFLLLTGRAARAGAALAVVGGAYFAVMKFAVMPHFGGGRESFLNQYAGLLPEGGGGYGSVLGTVVANPVFTEGVLLERDKLVYVLQILVPVLFLPLVRPSAALLLAPAAVFTLLSTGYAPLYQISFQYTTYWTAFVFVGVVLALEHAGRARDPVDATAANRQRALAIALAAVTIVCDAGYGAIVHREAARGGFDRVHAATSADDLRRRAELAALIAQIPPDGKVSAGEHLVPHVSGRESAYTLRFGLYDADWLLVQMPLSGAERDRAAPVLRDGTFGVVDDRGDLVLAHRGEPPTRNAAVLAR